MDTEIRTCRECGSDFHRWDTYTHSGSAAHRCNPCYLRYVKANYASRRGDSYAPRNGQVSNACLVTGKKPQGKAWEQRRLQVFAEETNCWICGGIVDQSLKGPDPMAKSVDHVEPQALGGSHDRENLRLAHFGCNAGRGNTFIHAEIRRLKAEVLRLNDELSRVSLRPRIS